MEGFWQEFFKAFMLLFAIMDPLATVPVLILLTKEMPREEQHRNINRAVLVAGTLLFIFLFAGDAILKFIGITVPSFRVAGGIILLILSIEFVLGIDLKGKSAQNYDVAIIPLATPLITGPGVIVTVMLLVIKHGYLIAISVSCTCLLLTWLILKQTSLIYKLIGRQGIDILTRIMGLLLTGLAVEFIRTGLKG